MIHLDLLGLVIDLAPIHLNIVADPTGGLLAAWCTDRFGW